MSEVWSFFEKNKQQMLENINTCSFARIIDVDLKVMKADVKPLFEKDAPPILNVPIMTLQTSEFIVRMPFKKEDIVILIFSQRDIDPIMYGDGEKSERMLGIDDAIIIGGISLFTTPLPSSDHIDDVVISKKNFSSKIVLTNSGDIILKAENKLVLDGPGGIDIKGGDITMTGDAITANGEDLNTDLT